MPTIVELSAPFENYLLPVLAAGNGICPECHCPFGGRYDRCFQCSLALKLPARLDAASFVSLAVNGEQLARDLYIYKSRGNIREASTKSIGLAAVLWRWLKLHEACVARVAGSAGFDIVTTIPSHKNPHPIQRIVSEKVAITSARYEPLLTPGPTYSQNRQFLVDRFSVTRRSPGGESVLVIDDTFTTGSQVHSAAAALKSAGFTIAGAVCIGRHINPESQDLAHKPRALRYVNASHKVGWNWDVCCLCDTRSLAPI